jgi:hypothetical protein
MKVKALQFLAIALTAFFTGCASGPKATTGTAVGAVAGAVVAGPVGLVAGGAVGNAYGDDQDRSRRRRR